MENIIAELTDALGSYPGVLTTLVLCLSWRTFVLAAACVGPALLLDVHAPQPQL